MSRAFSFFNYFVKGIQRDYNGRITDGSAAFLFFIKAFYLSDNLSGVCTTDFQQII